MTLGRAGTRSLNHYPPVQQDLQKVDIITTKSNKTMHGKPAFRDSYPRINRNLQARRLSNYPEDSTMHGQNKKINFSYRSVKKEKAGLQSPPTSHTIQRKAANRVGESICIPGRESLGYGPPKKSSVFALFMNQTLMSGSTLPHISPIVLGWAVDSIG